MPFARQAGGRWLPLLAALRPLFVPPAWAWHCGYRFGRPPTAFCCSRTFAHSSPHCFSAGHTRYPKAAPRYHRTHLLPLQAHGCSCCPASVGRPPSRCRQSLPWFSVADRLLHQGCPPHRNGAHVLACPIACAGCPVARYGHCAVCSPSVGWAHRGE